MSQNRREEKPGKTLNQREERGKQREGREKGSACWSQSGWLMPAPGSKDKWQTGIVAIRLTSKVQGRKARKRADSVVLREGLMYLRLVLNS